MRVVLTASEINNRGCWGKFCKERGINEWAMNEGRLDGDTEFSFTEEEAKNYGFIRKDPWA